MEEVEVVVEVVEVVVEVVAVAALFECSSHEYLTA